MSLLQNSNAISSGGYNLESSLRFRGGQNLTRTITSASNRRTYTQSVWLKRGAIGTSPYIFNQYLDGNTNSLWYFNASSSEAFNVFNRIGGTNYQVQTSASFRDTSAWYHIVVATDTTQATASNRVKIWINGEQVTSFSSTGYPPQNSDTAINSASTYYIGSSYASSQYFDGYMTEYNFVDGQALTADDFGEYDDTTGVWKPKEYLGTYGTNGFYLPFKETQQATGFNTVLWTGTGIAPMSISGVGFQPDLIWIKGRNSTYQHRLHDSVRGSNQYLMSHTTDAEATFSNLTIDSDGFTVDAVGSQYIGSGGNFVAWCWDTNTDNTTGSELITNGTFDTDTSSWTAVDGTLSASGGKLTVTRTGSTFGAAYQAISTTSGKMYAVKFDTEYVAGNGNFVLVGTSPSNTDLGTFGPYTTNSNNNVVTFIATGSTTYIRLLADTLIGVTAIWDNISVKEVTQDGTIPSYYKANPTTGFSVVSYTGVDTPSTNTIGHGLNNAPELIIIKNRNASTNWYVATTLLANPVDYALLNLTNAFAQQTLSPWNTPPTSSVFTLGANNADTCDLGSNYVAYCFHSVAGYSKFGTYTGNGSVGNSVTGLGFKPAFLMVKRTDSTSNWTIKDNTRGVTDSTNRPYLYANTADAEGDGLQVSFDSDGFTWGTTSTTVNASGGTYIYMAFADTRDAQFNFDASGNKNNWTANNINSNASSETTYDIMNDVPTLTDEDTANFCTLNPLDRQDLDLPTSYITNGNLEVDYTNAAAINADLYGSIYVPKSGKWYFEARLDAYYGSSSLRFGFSAGAAYLSVSAVGDYAIAVDWDNELFWTRTNGTWTGDPEAGTGGTSCANSQTLIAPYVRDNSGSTGNGGKWIVNFGQRPFKYTPPTGFKKINTYNLPDSTIVDGSQYMNTVLYTGNGTSGTSITNVEFSPDLVWIKQRDVVRSHALFDSVRGVGARLQSDTTDAEAASSNLSSFDSDGFTLGNSSQVNGSGGSYAAWNWRASDSSPVSNTNGTITSTVSANTRSGFSVVTYTGNDAASATVGHGLGVAPKMIVVKRRNLVGTNGWDNWGVYHSSLGATKVLWLQLNSAEYVSSIAWNNTAPSSTVFTIANSAGGGFNDDPTNYVAYCFAEVEGFSKFGSYTGNGSTDGPFIFTNFLPKYIMIKSSSIAGEWAIYDIPRDLYNPMGLGGGRLQANTSNAETSADSAQYIDFLSNGFKIRNISGFDNESSATYIYMAFAENPFKNSLAR